MLTLLLITGDGDVARYAVDCGVGRLFVDLEARGKRERQLGRDTVISGHGLDDVARVRAAAPEAELLVRIEPYDADATAGEVEAVVAAGADLVMLPMCTGPRQVARVAALLGGRAGLVPLIETPQALTRCADLAAVDGVAECYVGLNDLSLGLGLDFLFEPLAGGLIDHLAGILRAVGLPFGFGGIGRLDAGAVPGELVLGEHLRLGSTRAILSRAFTGPYRTLDELRERCDLAAAIAGLRAAERRLAERDPKAVARDHARVREAVAAERARLLAGR